MRHGHCTDNITSRGLQPARCLLPCAFRQSLEEARTRPYGPYPIDRRLFRNVFRRSVIPK